MYWFRFNLFCVSPLCPCMGMEFASGPLIYADVLFFGCPVAAVPRNALVQPLAGRCRARSCNSISCKYTYVLYNTYRLVASLLRRPCACRLGLMAKRKTPNGLTIANKHDGRNNAKHKQRANKIGWRNTRPENFTKSFWKII